MTELTLKELAKAGLVFLIMGIAIYTIKLMKNYRF